MHIRILSLLALSTIPAAALAQTPTPPAAAAPAAPAAAIAVGMPVVDAAGAAVGTVTAIAGPNVTVKTDKHSAQLPSTSLAVSEGKALIGMTQAELNASVEKTLAATPKAELKSGASVKGSGGTLVGTVSALDAETVTIKLTSGTDIRIPRSGIAVEADGGGVIGLTAAQLEAQVKAGTKAQ